jgi:quercetin dioxygenase-like cupin family protein
LLQLGGVIGRFSGSFVLRLQILERGRCAACECRVVGSKFSLPFYRGEHMLGNLRIRRAAAALLAGGALFVLATADPTRALQPAGPLLHTGTTVVGEAVVYPAGAAQVTAAVVTLAPGQETGWHTHGMPVVGYVIEGELEVDYGDKGVRVYRAGEALMEAIGIAHNGRNVGSAPMRILAVFIGAEGLKTSLPVSR